MDQIQASRPAAPGTENRTTTSYRAHTFVRTEPRLLNAVRLENGGWLEWPYAQLARYGLLSQELAQ
jgi:phage pi2 protein 07